MDTQKIAFNKVAKIKTDLSLIDKLESKYKSLGKADVSRFISDINRIENDLKSSIDKVGDLLDEVKKAQAGYNSMGDTDNSKIASRLVNDIQNDFDEMIFIYNKVKGI
jgi:paraquat-inducible protein B